MCRSITYIFRTVQTPNIFNILLSMKIFYERKVFASVNTDLVSQRINLYVTKPNYEAKLNRPLHNHRVGGAFKVQKGFQLQQMQLFNSVIDMAHFYFSEPICPNFFMD